MPIVSEKIHDWMSSSKMAAVHVLSGQHFLVTGCAMGSLGFATALQLLQQGAVVTITVRKQHRSIVEALQAALPTTLHSHVHGFDLDLSERQSVENFAKDYTQSGLPLDVLINNAGIHLDLLSQWQQPKQCSEGFEIQWRVNYLGTAQLTLALMPLLINAAKKTGDSRIINVASQLHSKGSNDEFFQPKLPYNSWRAYGQSKLGLLHFTQSLSHRFAEHDITSYSLHPGAVYTNVATQGLVNTGAIERVRKLFSPLEKTFLKSPKQGAQTTLHCATAHKDQLECGGYYRNLQLSPAAEDAYDYAVSEKLWQQLQHWLEPS